MTIRIEKAGEFDGKPVHEAHLVSDTGVEVDLLSWGVTVRDWRVPVAAGTRSMVLGFESFDPYPAHSPHFGSLAGRVANRIAGARFELDGETFVLPANEGPNSLHGGPEGLGRQVWDLEPDAVGNGVKFTFVSPDGASGYPGTVKIEALYTLRGNRLRLDLSATTDRPTPLSLVQHQYFNIGTGSDVLDHHVTINASARSEVGRDLIPTGAILPVYDTPYDLRKGRTLRDANHEPIDYDLNLVLFSRRDLADPVATALSPERDVKLQLWTDRPAVQFYNGVMTDCSVPGLGGRRYGKYSGLCLEDQKFPGALSHPHFPSIIITPDEPYSHWSIFEIGDGN
jgi:aldose 1-epimerase